MKKILFHSLLICNLFLISSCGTSGGEKESKNSDSSASQEQVNKKKQNQKKKENKQENKEKDESNKGNQLNPTKPISLSEIQKEKINQEMVRYCNTMASRNQMMLSREGFITPRGVEGGTYTVNTQDGPAHIFDHPSGLNVVGKETFYTPTEDGSGVQNDRGISDVKPNTEIKRYVWCNNGKVYEWATRTDGTIEDMKLQGWYTLYKDGERLAKEDVTFHETKDKEMQKEYTRIFDEVKANSTKNSPEEQGKWNKNKSVELDSFMQQWSQKMNQKYSPGTINTEKDYIMMAFKSMSNRKNLVEGTECYVPQYKGKDFDYTCGQPQNKDQYQVVACYGPAEIKFEDGNSEKPHYYIFAIRDNKGIVFNCDDENGSIRQTSNQELQEGFAKIVEQKK